MVGLTSLTVKRDLLGLARTASSSTLKFIGIISMEAILPLTCVYVLLYCCLQQLIVIWVVRRGRFSLGYTCVCRL